MPSYEIGKEVRKVCKRTLSERVIKNSLDKFLLDFVLKPKARLSGDDIALFFKDFLQVNKEK